MVLIHNTVWNKKHLKIEFITYGRAGKGFHSGIKAMMEEIRYMTAIQA